LHAVLPAGHGGGSPVAWWQAHQALQVADSWRAGRNKHQQVLLFAAPVGSIGRQPREDCCATPWTSRRQRKLVASALPLAGT